MSFIAIPIPIVKGGTGAITQSGAQTSLNVPDKTTVMLLSGAQAMSGSLDAGSHTIINVAAPVNGTDVVNKTYVDSAIQGIRWVGTRVATTAPVTLAGGTPSTLDGVSLATNDLVLVKNQSTAAQNGIYTVTTVGSGSNGTWSRATNFTTSANYANTIIAIVDEGTAGASTKWILAIDPDSPPTLGSTSLNWTQDAGTSYSQGNGINITGTTITAVGDSTTITVGAGGIGIATGYVGQSSITTLGTISTGTWSATTIALNKGGTGSTTASGARGNLQAAPNTASYWLGVSNGELGSGIVPTQGTGILLNAPAGTVAIDTSVVLTTTNSPGAISGKTFTAPILNQPVINRAVTLKTASYTLLAADDFVKYTISSGANATLLASGSATTGQIWSIKNAAASSANVTVQTNGTDKLENNSAGTFILAPGDAIDVIWDGVEYCIY